MSRDCILTRGGFVLIASAALALVACGESAGGSPPDGGQAHDAGTDAGIAARDDAGDRLEDAGIVDPPTDAGDALEDAGIVDPPTDAGAPLDAGYTLGEGECDSDQQCQEEGHFCHRYAGCHGPGMCELAGPRPCQTILRVVCGCDGRDYDNRCNANAAGVSVSHEGSCAAP